jgi:hypothetical protein
MNLFELDEQSFELKISSYPEEVKEELRAGRRQIEEERRRTEEERRRTEEERRRTEEERRRAEVAELRSTNLSLQVQLTRGTPTQTYDNAVQISHVIEDFPWRTVPHNTLIRLWKHITGHMNQQWTDKSDEDSIIHPIMLYVLDYLRTELEVNVIFHNRPSIGNVFPDFVGTSPNVVRPSWHDSIFVGEMKVASQTKMKEAVGEAIKYSLTDFKIGETEKVVFGSNLLSIQFAHLCPNLVDLVLTEMVPLFPNGWRQLEKPTRGFALLCQMLYFPLPQIKFVVIGGSRVPVSSILYETADLGIYVVPIHGNHLIAKVGVTKITSSMIKYVEPAKHEAVSGIPGMSEYMVPIRRDYEVTDGFLMEQATPITEWKGDLQSAMLQIFQGLKIMHGSNFYHLDIRPSNIMIYNGTARLIDWVTCVNQQNLTPSTLMQGHKDYFWPSDPDAYRNRPALWDILGFAYTFFFLESDLESRTRFYENRDATIESFESERSVKGAASRLIQYVKDLQQAEFNYDIANQILNG